MKKIIAAGAALIVLCLPACGPGDAEASESIDYDGIIASWEEAGKTVRPCEKSARSKDCEFAARDAYDLVRGTYKPLIDAGLNHQAGYKAAYDVGYDWNHYASVCFKQPIGAENATKCIANVPSEADADRAIVGIRALRNEGGA